MTATERRRNAYADHCYVCRSAVEAGAGWLYSDVRSQKSRSRHRSYGSFRKVVKCDRCHSENIAHKWQADNLDNPKPAEPVVRSWSIAQVKKWTLEVATVANDDGGFTSTDVALYVVGPFGRQLISCRDRIGCFIDAPTGYQLEEWEDIGGKQLSKSAADHLSPLILATVKEINRKEHEGELAAVARLTEAGIDLEKHPNRDFWTIKMGGTVILAEKYESVAIELWINGDYFVGSRINGYDRRSGVSKLVSLSVDEVIALANAKGE